MNRLRDSQSRYLRQHAEHPVDWWPWGPQALEAAQKANKPLLVSVGYSACHWCHVMARESFSDAYVAELMNRHFICIKVDREEHPALDAQLIEAVQLLGEQGGWPLNVFCLPDGRPFFGGTYFPKKDTQGRIPWPQLLMRVSHHFLNKPQEFEDNAQAIVGNMQHSNAPIHPEHPKLEPSKLLHIAQELLGRADPQYGGLSGPPKFPQGRLLQFLMQVPSLPGCPTKLAQQARKALEKNLEAMAQGGLYDQLGGGFFRYTVDRAWRKPHFEKMLYDQGLLLECYAKAYADTPSPLYKKIIEETVAHTLEAFQDETGLFAASFDAETESGEGSYYLWSYKEIEACLATQAPEFARAYGMQPNTQEPQHLFFRGTPQERQALEPLRQQLLAQRLKRPPPAKDPKHLLSWNALWLKGLCACARVLKRKDWEALAASLADQLWAVFHDGHQLRPLHYAGYPAQGHALLEDYALFASALLSLNDQQAYKKGFQLLLEALQHFKDPDGPGYFSTQAHHPLLPVRKKVWMDTSTPCGQGALLYALAQALDTPECPNDIESAHQELLRAYSGLLSTLPSACPSALLCALPSSKT